MKIDDELVQAAFDRYHGTARGDGPRTGKSPSTLMDCATIGAKALKQRGHSDRTWTRARRSTPAPSRSTCDVDGEQQDWLLMFKNETHNHPTEIEPFGGAATCIGGAIRDPLSGRSYVYQAMRVTGAATRWTPVDRDHARQAAPAQAGHRPPPRAIPPTATRSALPPVMVARAVPPRLRRQAHGDRRGGGRGARQHNVRREQPAPGDVVILLGGRTGPRRLSAAPPAPPRRTS